MPDVVIYTRSWCGSCIRAKALLARKGVAYTAIEISDHDDPRDEMIARAGGRRTVPQIFIGATHAWPTGNTTSGRGSSRGRGRSPSTSGAGTERVGTARVADTRMRTRRVTVPAGSTRGHRRPGAGMRPTGEPRGGGPSAPPPGGPHRIACRYSARRS